MTTIIKKGFVSFLFTLILSPTFAFALDELYDAPGFDPNRETFSSMPNEHIDTFTGGLILTFEDIRLPGNGGLDLVIQRTYNSKNICNHWEYTPGGSCSADDENTWLGYGWTLHFGRLFKSTNDNVPHVIEMPDGSRHPAYHNISSSYRITKDYWLLDKDSYPPVTTLTNGTKIYYGQSGPLHPDYPSHIAYNATKIQDVNGNEINIYYPYGSNNMISYIIDSVGRRIDFTTATINNATRLTSISGPGVSISYTHKTLPSSGHTVLVEASPPVGNSWKYAYNESLYELTQVTTPAGGIISYNFGFAEVSYGSYAPVRYRVVTQKATSGGRIPNGTWTFAYSQGPRKDYTQIIDPCQRNIRYYYFGYGEDLPSGNMWKMGLRKKKEIVNEETTNYTWTNSSPISYDPYSPDGYRTDTAIYVPLMTKKSITRDGKTYVTNYSNYDSYANPRTISETGDTTRNKSISYWYNKPKNIVQNKPFSEIVSGGLSGTFTTNYFYDSDTGNLLQLNKYGVVTTYTYYPYTNPNGAGNLWTKTDANVHATTYGWSNGKISQITNPIYSISRVINSNGTIASETNGRGFSTSFTYDGNLRLTSITPPVGNPTNLTYPTDNSYKYESRGQYYIYHYNDGFGRPTGSLDIKGIDIDIVYKACGPKYYSTSNIGDTIYYDNFGRPTQAVHKDGTRIAYSYSLSNLTVNDEERKNKSLYYYAFGNPDEKLLLSVVDPLNYTTSYNYNILGSLTNITQGALGRTFAYDTKNFLASETHPEKGTVTYGRDNVGNMTSKSDGLGTTSYTYDAINRLLAINYGTGAVTFTYDNADNRITMSNPGAAVTYGYDASNRLTSKTETILGRTYYTDYRYDGNDNLTDVYYPPAGYPSGRHIVYTYNSNNQVSSIPGFVTNVNYYTSGTSIGLPSSITHANNRVTSLSYNSRNLTTQINAGTALNIGYGYADARGNMTSITNNLDTSKNQTFTYDELSRLKTFDGPWGTGSFNYDSTGNRLTKTVAAVPTNYTYLNNRLSSASGGETFSFTYNTDGDATGINGYTLQYDRLHNLTSYKQGTTPIADFTYDGDGLRVTKTSGGKTTVYHYDKEGKVLSETDELGNLLVDYVYLHGKLAAKIVNDTVPPGGSIVINNGNATTHTAYATLTLSASDPGSAVSRMRFSNDGITWSDWEDYASTKLWVLTYGNGVKTVYVQFQDSAGNTSSYSTSINLLIYKEMFDSDGDRKNDFAVWRASNGYWYILRSSDGGTTQTLRGTSGDIPVPGDYDGDGKTDISVYRPSNGGWYIIPSGVGAAYAVGWGGEASDKPVPGDYDGDGKTDIAIYRGSNGAWYITPSSGAAAYAVGWGGEASDKPVPGDYDGDGKTDIAIYRGSNGAWYIIPSTPSGTPYGMGWGGDPSDIPFPGDYDGDGKTDIAIYRGSNGGWYIIPSSGAAAYAVGWGGPGYTPIVGDFDGDGKTDIAVYQASTGIWYIKPSSGAAAYAVGWGGDPSDIPITTNRASY